jgi:hypothetical protein
MPMNLPTASVPRPNLRAKVSLTTATRAVPDASVSAKSRPATRRMPLVAKYPAPTALKRARELTPGPDWNPCTFTLVVQSLPPSSGIRDDVTAFTPGMVRSSSSMRA